MAWQETVYPFSVENYDIVAPPAGVSVVGDLQVVADTTDCEDVRMGWNIWVFGGGDEYTCTIQYFDETEQDWVEIPPQLSCGGGGGIGMRSLSSWWALPSGAIGEAVTFRPIGVDGDSTTTATLANWEVIVRKQVEMPQER